MAVTDQAENQSNKVPTTHFGQTLAAHTPGPWLRGGLWNENIFHPKSDPSDDETKYIVTISHLTGAALSPEDEANARLISAAPEMLEALESALYGMDELIRSYTITHVVRGQCKGQPRINADEMSAASEAEDQYRQARHKIEAAIQKAKGAL